MRNNSVSHNIKLNKMGRKLRNKEEIRARLLSIYYLRFFKNKSINEIAFEILYCSNTCIARTVRLFNSSESSHYDDSLYKKIFDCFNPKLTQEKNYQIFSEKYSEEPISRAEYSIRINEFNQNTLRYMKDHLNMEIDPVYIINDTEVNNNMEEIRKYLLRFEVKIEADKDVYNNQPEKTILDRIISRVDEISRISNLSKEEVWKNIEDGLIETEQKLLENKLNSLRK